MASPVDILLKVTTDVRDAVAGFGKVEQSAREADQRVGQLGDRVRGLARRGASSVGAAAGTFAAGGSLGEALLAGIGAEQPELAVALLGVDKASEPIDRLTGQAGKVTAAEKRLGAPLSAADAAEALKAAANAKAGGALSGGLGGILGKVVATRGPLGGGSFRLSEFGRTAREKALHDLFRAMARDNPALASAVLTQLGNPSDLADILADEQRQALLDAQRGAQSQAFLATIAPQASVTNVYTAFSGLGGRSALGREVRSVLDARDRNNGRYVTTWTRR